MRKEKGEKRRALTITIANLGTRLWQVVNRGVPCTKIKQSLHRVSTFDKGSSQGERTAQGVAKNTGITSSILCIVIGYNYSLIEYIPWESTIDFTNHFTITDLGSVFFDPLSSRILVPVLVLVPLPSLPTRVVSPFANLKKPHAWAIAFYV